MKQQNNKLTYDSYSQNWWKRYKILLIILFLIVIFSLPLFILQQKGAVLGKSVHEILNDLGGYKEIIHIEEVNNGLVVFYIPQINTDDVVQESTDLSVIFIKRTLFGLRGTIDRGFFASNRSDIPSMYVPQIDESSHSPFPILFGYVNNPKITKVRVVNSNNNIQETDVMKKGDHSIWFMFMNDKNNVSYQIQGLTDENELIITFPQNEKGQTFGSASFAPTPEDEPDLISAVGVDGTIGYVKKEDLYGPQPKTPDEAVRLTNEAKPREIPLYDVDGETIIGKFIVGG